ncbi:MAG TPA: hypothetical protein VIO61_10625 [Anaerolineaceae bacterium]
MAVHHQRLTLQLLDTGRYRANLCRRQYIFENMAEHRPLPCQMVNRAAYPSQLAFCRSGIRMDFYCQFYRADHRACPMLQSEYDSVPQFSLWSYPAFNRAAPPAAGLLYPLRGTI